MIRPINVNRRRRSNSSAITPFIVLTRIFNKPCTVTVTRNRTLNSIKKAIWSICQPKTVTEPPGASIASLIIRLGSSNDRYNSGKSATVKMSNLICSRREYFQMNLNSELSNRVFPFHNLKASPVRTNLHTYFPLISHRIILSQVFLCPLYRILIVMLRS